MVPILRRLLLDVFIWSWTASISAAGPPIGRNLGPNDCDGSTTTNTAPITPTVTAVETKPQIDPQQIDLAEVLRRWEQGTAGRTRLDCRFRRHRFDHLFQVEYRSEGALAIDREGRAAYRFEPVIVQRDSVSGRRNDVGAPYAVIADQRQRWHWTGSVTIHVDESSKIYERISYTGAPIWHPERPQPPPLPEEPTSGFLRELALLKESLRDFLDSAFFSSGTARRRA